jgi:hypothetical protein
MLIFLNVPFIFITWSLSFVSKLLIDGISVVALALVTKTKWGYVSSTCCDVIDEQLIFCSFPINGLCNKFSIAICKFYKLYGEYRAFGRGWLHGWPMTHSMLGLNLALQ